MPSFPDSVKVFTTKLDGAGNPINAAHVNDLQDEVNAIEAGYINATAPLNSSRSTVATLSVTGASTFAVRPVMPIPYGYGRVFVASTLTIGSSADSTITWLQDDFLQNSSIHSTTTNPERLIPQTTGIYAVSAQLEVSSNSTGYRQILIEDSSGGIVGRSIFPESTSPVIFQASGYKRFDALGGYVTCHFNSVFQSTLSISSGSAGSWFAMHLL